MPPYTVIFHRLAASEVAKASRWYAQRSAFVAQRFQAAVQAASQAIEADPTRVPVDTDGSRARKVHGFPYLLRYDITGPQLVTIYAVAHTSRRPGYWRRRRP